MIHLLIHKDNTYSFIVYPAPAKDILRYNEMLAEGLWTHKIDTRELVKGIDLANTRGDSLVVFNEGKYQWTQKVEE